MSTEFSGKRRLAAGAVMTMLVLALCGCTAHAAEYEVDESLEVMDLPAPKPLTGTVKASFARIVEPEFIETEFGAEYIEPIDAPSWGTYYEVPVIGTYYAEYSELYNTDGPTPEMPGWYDGYLETYYSSNVMRHSLTDEWEIDDEGFYRTTDGYYVIGMDIAKGVEKGTVVDTGKGEAVVMDYGSGAHVHDFNTAW